MPIDEKIVQPYPYTELFREHGIVSLKHALSEHFLQAGTKGTIIHVHERRAGFEVEFVDAVGSVKIVTLKATDIDPVF